MLAEHGNTPGWLAGEDNQPTTWRACPFCGGAASKCIGHHGDGFEWEYIECESCGASAEPQFWNRRELTAGQRLGARLAELLDEDHWSECERLPLEAGVVPATPHMSRA